MLFGKPTLYNNVPLWKMYIFYVSMIFLLIYIGDIIKKHFNLTFFLDGYLRHVCAYCVCNKVFTLFLFTSANDHIVYSFFYCWDPWICPVDDILQIVIWKTVYCCVYYRECRCYCQLCTSEYIFILPQTHKVI